MSLFPRFEEFTPEYQSTSEECASIAFAAVQLFGRLEELDDARVPSIVTDRVDSALDSGGSKTLRYGYALLLFCSTNQMA